MTGKIKYPELKGKTRMQKQVRYNKEYRNKNLIDEREKARIRVQRHRDKMKIREITERVKKMDGGYFNPMRWKDYYTLEELEGE